MRWFFIVALLVFPFAAAASGFQSVDDRADAVSKSVKGVHSYQAYLARKFEL